MKSEDRGMVPVMRPVLSGGKGSAEPKSAVSHCTRVIFFAFVVLFSLFFFVSPRRASAGEAIVLGVHPYIPATEIIRRFTPLADYLGRELGASVTIEISKDYNEHINSIGTGKVDIAFLGPASYVKMVDKYGKRPLLARLESDGRPWFSGVIIVRKGSPVKRLSDLAGRSFAFGDPASTMSHYVPRWMLWKAGVNVEKLSSYKFLSNHENIVLGVLMGDFDAGAVMEEVFHQHQERGLMALAFTPRISDHVFVASASLDADTVRKVSSALIGLKKTAEGRQIMRAIRGNITAMLPARDSDYDNLRTIMRELERQGVKL